MIRYRFFTNDDGSQLFMQILAVIDTIYYNIIFFLIFTLLVLLFIYSFLLMHPAQYFLLLILQYSFIIFYIKINAKQNIAFNFMHLIFSHPKPILLIFLCQSCFSDLIQFFLHANHYTLQHTLAILYFPSSSEHYILSME